MPMKPHTYSRIPADVLEYVEIEFRQIFPHFVSPATGFSAAFRLQRVYYAALFAMPYPAAALADEDETKSVTPG